MYIIEYIRKCGMVSFQMNTETRFMKMTANAFDALMKYSVGPDCGKIFGDAWLVRYEFLR